jgi:lysozyme
MRGKIKIIVAILIIPVIGSLFIFGSPKGTTAFGITIPLTYSIYGIDVSRYQQKINWNEVAKARGGKNNAYSVHFAFIKATEGKTLKDPNFKENWINSKKTNIIRGAYHYYKPNVKSTYQAQNFIKTIGKLSKGDLPPVLDIEETGKYGIDNLHRGLQNWLKIVEKHYGVKPIIYCFVDYYDKYFKEKKEYKDYQFWIAHHSKSSSRIKNKSWQFWQHSDKAKIKGISGNVCFNAFNGNKQKLQSLCIK